MNILIITDALTAPLYTPRVRFLNQRLLADGNSVVWFTEKAQDIPEKVRPSNLIEIPYYNNSHLDHLVKGLLSFLFDHKNRYFARHIKPATKPDLIFVSSFHTFGLRAALHLSHLYKTPLHIDLRDIAEQTPANSYSRSFLSASAIYRNINIRRRNRVLRYASTITTVSHFHKNLLSRINPNTHIVYNGYDATLFRAMPKTTSNKVNILYTGRWYGPDMQDPLPLFRTLEKADFPYELNFYTSPDVHQQLQEMAAKHNVQIHLHPYVSNEQVPALLNTADVALVLTSPSNKGVLTTKFFEALGCGIPVLCVPSDEGELASLIRSTKAGLASSNTEEILAFLRHPHAEVDNPEVFSRQHQTDILCSLF